MSDFAVHRAAGHEPGLVEALVEVTADCIEGGASIGFMLPVDRVRLHAFWTDAAARAADGERVLFVAADDAGGRVLGTVQLILATPENQPHRGEISKMLVHRRARRRGIGEALMLAAENAAIEAGRTLLVLDTASGDAERLYVRCGWQRAGVIPDYALWPAGGFVDTTIFFRRLTSARARSTR